MPARKRNIPRVGDENFPARQCGDCSRCEPSPDEIDEGICFGWPPQGFTTDGGGVDWERPVVKLVDRACHIFDPRHKA